jgi:tetratricopeptide (TPR) repeat protein
LGRLIDAIDGFSIAAASPEYRAASYVEISKLLLRQKQYGEARRYALKAIETNPMEVPAWELLVTIERLEGNREAAAVALAQLEALDPLDHLIRFERYLLNPSEKTADVFKSVIRSEFPHQVFLELAVWYFNLGLESDVATLLSQAPEQPEILYWRAWLAEKSNNLQQSVEYLKKADAGSPYLVFPFLPESVEPLGWARQNSSSWKPTYYLGLIYWSRKRTDLAKALFQECGNEPDFYPFYLARVKLFELADPLKTEQDLLRAVSLAPDAWRAGLQLSRFYENQKELIKANQVAASFYKESPQNYYLGLNLARQLILNGEHEACADLLEKLQVLPNEGATEGHQLWRKSNLQIAMKAYAAKKYQRALEFIEQSRRWPENLGVGKPYDTDERLPDFLESLCSKAMDDQDRASELEEAIMSYAQLNGYHPSGSIDLLSAWLLRKNGEEAKAADLIETLRKQQPRNKSTRWVEAMYHGNKTLAVSIGKEKDTLKDIHPYEKEQIDNDLRLMLRLSEIFDF